MKRLSNIASGLLLALCLTTPSSATTILDPGPHTQSYLGFSRGYWFAAPTHFAITGVRTDGRHDRAAANSRNRAF